MKPASGATPLIALNAVAIDTETTGLDASKARIVQMGAVAIAAGRIDDGATLDLLVDPGIPIPPASSRIHNITNAMVRNAPQFPEAWERLRAFTGARVLVGHSIGFDLAVFEKETGRASLPWERPRTLCVRMLAQVANPGLADYTLDMLASWLGVTVGGRHSALGDARAAAEIFLALLPKLQERGIRTLAEAERASLRLTSELDKAHQAGWVAPVAAPAAPVFQAIDPYAYRHRVGDLMSAPPVVARADATARDVIALMVERRISSVFVSEAGEADAPVLDYGILTERDVMRLIAARGEAAFACKVGEVATRPLASIRTQAFAYRAIGRMDRLKIRHLAVRHEDGRLAGIVSARDLLKLRAGVAINLDDRLEVAGSAAEMAAAWATLPTVADGLISERLDARVIAEIVSEELCAVTRRAAVLAETAMAADGLGAPPCPYALLVLGSGGRGESLLAADQDNAIVFAAGEPGGPEDRWFAELGRRIADILDTAGVPYCKGGVMAKNPEFRGSLELWKTRIAEWVRRSRPQDLLNVDIVFDMRPIHGDNAIGYELFEYAYRTGHAEAHFAKLLGANLDQIGNPFTLFGGFQVEDGRLDLKKYGLFPIVATARTLAIRHDIRERSTKARLERLIGLGIGGDQDMAAMLSGHTLLLSLLLAQQSRDLHSGVPASNRVEVTRLSKVEQADLKSVLKQLQSASALVKDLMFG
jgi:DNA polymerase-3 subunit epsilon/CBS domain-containing protein